MLSFSNGKNLVFSVNNEILRVNTHKANFNVSGKSGDTLGFPGGSVFKTPHSHCRGHRFSLWSGN